MRQFLLCRKVKSTWLIRTQSSGKRRRPLCKRRTKWYYVSSVMTETLEDGTQYFLNESPIAGPARPPALRGCNRSSRAHNEKLPRSFWRTNTTAVRAAAAADVAVFVELPLFAAPAVTAATLACLLVASGYVSSAASRVVNESWRFETTPLTAIAVITGSWINPMEIYSLEVKAGIQIHTYIYRGYMCMRRHEVYSMNISWYHD